MSYLTREQIEALDTIADRDERHVFREALLRANLDQAFPEGSEFCDALKMSLDSRQMPGMLDRILA
jgi:hypothetical protein